MQTPFAWWLDPGSLGWPVYITTIGTESRLHKPHPTDEGCVQPRMVALSISVCLCSSVTSRSMRLSRSEVNQLASSELIELMSRWIGGSCAGSRLRIGCDSRGSHYGHCGGCHGRWYDRGHSRIHSRRCCAGRQHWCVWWSIQRCTRGTSASLSALACDVADFANAISGQAWTHHVYISIIMFLSGAEVLTDIC